jgi:capping protein alpha
MAQVNKIKKYIIKGAPYGETNQVLEDLSKLVEELDINDEDTTTLLKDHNEEHFALILEPESNKLFIPTKYNAHEDFYVDTRSRTKLYINHAEHKITSIEPFELELDDQIAYYRDVLDDLCVKHIEEYYKDGTSAYNVTAKGQPPEFLIHIAMTAKNMNFKNFYGGEWLSEWKLDASANLEGNVKINAHYFEDGNVQLKLNKAFSFPMDLKAEADVNCQRIFEKIRESEDQILKGLDALYESLPSQVFKTMRKALPVTNTKMDWNLHVHKMVNTLKHR